MNMRKAHEYRRDVRRDYFFLIFHFLDWSLTFAYTWIALRFPLYALNEHEVEDRTTDCLLPREHTRTEDNIDIRLCGY